MIKVYSRKDMIEHINMVGVQKDQYYISILPTGGPHGYPIFKPEDNILTLVFDDVEYDCIKSAFPDSNNLRFARAINEKQVNLLCNFVKKIPSNKLIHIHCVHGVSRSMAVACAIENKPNSLYGNKLVYKLVREQLHA